MTPFHLFLYSFIYPYMYIQAHVSLGGKFVGKFLLLFGYHPCPVGLNFNHQLDWGHRVPRYLVKCDSGRVCDVFWGPDIWTCTLSKADCPLHCGQGSASPQGNTKPRKREPPPCPSSSWFISLLPSGSDSGQNPQCQLPSPVTRSQMAGCGTSHNATDF